MLFDSLLDYYLMTNLRGLFMMLFSSTICNAILLVCCINANFILVSLHCFVFFGVLNWNATVLACGWIYIDCFYLASVTLWWRFTEYASQLPVEESAARCSADDRVFEATSRSYTSLFVRDAFQFGTT